MRLIDGKAVAEKIQEQIKEKVAEMRLQSQRVPHLAAVLVGNDGASLTYVSNKVRACEKVGFRSTLIHLPEYITEAELLAQVQALNENPDIDGYIVQLPLPSHINAKKITYAISPDKDVDGFHPTNVGKLALGLPTFVPATPLGIIQLIEHYQISTEGKHCVVIGRSHIVGLPMSLLMSRNAYPGNCTVTLTHSRTANLAEETRRADILIAALGKPEFIKAEMVKEGAVVIDVGITRLPDASKKSGFVLKGDVAFEEVAPRCSYITPVPGGVGPMTIAALLKNTLLAAEKVV
ncbi:MAG: bifunctional methylenetetrahydrofolate dehydrogenase/methenyltetrahydrofolate cyclohydrolase FolD [Cytophagales bacterium]|nr:bifunctional methylenetetrahydrofolate dehydrogenase/methenyltetrahydrofolate cyclohydrolase FolD [Bernardetiaceae bacterium]MDW8211689.1 bifunctional methylenetetrahydrofolate dehydrogenase/methenyltetrahydrofolate cyclohydrolase FolD [Cytophagales bacterium]